MDPKEGISAGRAARFRRCFKSRGGGARIVPKMRDKVPRGSIDAGA